MQVAGLFHEGTMSGASWFKGNETERNAWRKGTMKKHTVESGGKTVAWMQLENERHSREMDNADLAKRIHELETELAHLKYRITGQNKPDKDLVHKLNEALG